MTIGRRILLTGGTGTFGRAYIERALQDDTLFRLVVFSRDELKQSELRRQFPDPRLECVLGDVRDRDAVRDVMELEPFDLVIHAAALKHVASGEAFPEEVIKTNIRGAEHVASAALERNVQTVVALSTDKAVAPINLYGRTKAVAESIFLAANARAWRIGKRTRFAIVRYGNVVGSRGSVVPLFLEQARAGVFRVTDKRATRFWMPIEQAVDTVEYAARSTFGGEVIVPQIPSAKVVDVALALGPRCEIVETGLARGEKLHEQLIAAEEIPLTSEIDGYYVIANAPRPGATPVPSGFFYRSDMNPVPVELKQAVNT